MTSRKRSERMGRLLHALNGHVVVACNSLEQVSLGKLAAIVYSIWTMMDARSFGTEIVDFFSNVVRLLGF